MEMHKKTAGSSKIRASCQVVRTGRNCCRINTANTKGSRQAVYLITPAIGYDSCSVLESEFVDFPEEDRSCADLLIVIETH